MRRAFTGRVSSHTQLPVPEKQGRLISRPHGGPVVIGFASALCAPEVAWSLRDAGYPVIALARRGTRPALRRASGVEVIEVAAPENDAATTVREVGDAVRAHGASAMLPLDDAAVCAFARVSSEADLPLAGPNGSQLDLALDKRLQVSAAEEAGLHVPPTQAFASADVVTPARSFPLIVKPALAIAHDGTRLRKHAAAVCADQGELDDALAGLPDELPLLVQPLLRGTGEGIFGLVDESGVRAWSAHRRIRMTNPQGSGSSACVSIAIDGELAEKVEALLGAAGWSGLFMAEFLRDRDGVPWFMELNGRAWGSMALARRAGAEYPAWAVDRLLRPERPVVFSQGQPGLVCRNLGLELVHLLMVMRGPKSKALTEWPSRLGAIRDVARFRRADRWYNSDPRDRWLLFEDAARTVSAALARARSAA